MQNHVTNEKCFETVYRPRGRQTLCEQRRPDLTHNDTIKRIQTSKQNIEFLKKLAKKQVEKLKPQNRGINIETFSKININKIDREIQQPRRSLGKVDTAEHSQRQQQQFALKKTGCRLVQEFSTKTQNLLHVSHHFNGEKIAADTLKYYLQFATDYYQQGFLQNIKYLENLAERNQLRRKRQLQLHQQQKKIIFSRAADGLTKTNPNTNILNIKSIRLEKERITDASLNSSDIKQQQINQINPIFWRKRQHVDNLTVNKFCPLNNDSNRNCAIRVNIKPQTANTRRQGNFFGMKEEIYGKNKFIQDTKDFNSMNDYLNGNLEYTQLQQHQQQQQQQQTLFHTLSVNNHNYTSKVLQLDTLIDNLRELDIQENRTNLPRITLTDYTHKYPNDEVDSKSRTTQDSAVERKPDFNSYLIKQCSLDCYNLDIPRETTHYQSEARPP